MINRSLLRIKAVQVLYAYFQTENMTPRMVEKELDKSIAQAYDLYLLLLALIPALSQYAESEIENRRNKYILTDADRNPNTRFADNMLAKQLGESKILRNFCEKSGFAWDNQSLMRSLYTQISHTPYFVEYMNSDMRSYASGKELWRKVFKKEIFENAELDNHLEELSIYWNDDIFTVASFVCKTIKSLNADDDADDKILPLYRDEADKEFVHTLLNTAVEQSVAYEALIDETTKNWELDRIAVMDMVIMKLALAELYTCPTIPVCVTLNEYIEIAKLYSTARSAPFINGVLDKMADMLLKTGKIVKPAELTAKKDEFNENAQE